jgi:hypothetical protein
MGDPTSSHAIAGTALRVSGAFKPYNHDKVETPSVGSTILKLDIKVTGCEDVVFVPE